MSDMLYQKLSVLVSVFFSENLVLTTGLKRKLATVKGKKADVSSVSPSSERLGKLGFAILICNMFLSVSRISKVLYHSLSQTDGV